MPQQLPQCQQTTTDQQTKPTISPTLNTNAQAALWILLTAQMQSQTGETSILQNPQVVGILQNLVSQAGSPVGTKSSANNDNGSNSINDLLNHPALSGIVNTSSLSMQPQPNFQGSINNSGTQANGDANSSNVLFPPTFVTNAPPQQSSLTQQQRTALLDTPKRPSLLGQAPLGFSNPPPQSQPAPSSSASGVSSVSVITNSQNDSSSTSPAILSNNLNNLLNAQNLSQLLGSLTGETQKTILPPSNDLNTAQRSSAGQRPVLLNNPPTQNSNNSQQSRMAPGISVGYSTSPPQPQAPPQAPQQNQQLAMAAAHTQINQFAQPSPSILSNISLQQPSSTTQSLTVSNPVDTQPPSNNYMAMVSSQPVAAPQNSFLLSNGYSMTLPPPTVTASQLASSPAFASVYGPPPIHPFGSAVASNTLTSAQSIYGPYVPASAVQVQPSTAQFSFGSPHIGSPANMITSYGAHQAYPVTSVGVQPSNIPNTFFPQQNTMVNQYPSPQQMQIQASTGPGLKRKLPIPPSPENSPDGPFIGQHSQGIGGHYADSYWRNRSQNSNKRGRF